jgi:predicted MFS family arabinose efflux permease
MTVASVVSVPVSTWAAAHIGPRSLFASIGFTTFIAVALIAFFVQNHSPGVRVKLAQFVDLARRPANITGLSVVFCSTAGSFVTYTMITPICVTGIQQVHILSRSRFWCMELQESVAI